MKKQISLRVLSLMLLVCMVLPFVPTAIEMLSVPSTAATAGSNILIYDDFQKGTSADYADSGSSSQYQAELKDGQLYLTSNANGWVTYLLPYDALSGLQTDKLTISFEYTLIDMDASNKSQTTLWLAYGASSNKDYSFAGLRFSTGAEWTGTVLNGSGNSRFQTKYHTMNGKTTPYEYSAVGTHTMTIQVTAGGYPRTYIDGVNERTNGFDSNAAGTLEGKFGFNFYQPGLTMAIDNFLVYEGHGNLSSTPIPTDTIGTPAGPRDVLFHDDFSSQYAYDYADPAQDWCANATGSFVDGELILDATGCSKVNETWFPFPYEVPAGTEAFTAEMQFRVLQGASGSGEHTANDVTYTYNYFNRNGIFLAYGAQGANDDLYISGVVTGDYNHDGNTVTSQYGYTQGKYEHWGRLTASGSKYSVGTTYRTMQEANILGNGFTIGKTYTLVVQVKEGEARAYIKEVSSTIPAWSNVSWAADHKGTNLAGQIGFYSREKSKVAISDLTVYEGVYTPPVSTDITEYQFDDYYSPSALAYQTANNANGTMQVTSGTVGTQTTGVMQATRKKATGTVHNKLPQSVPVGTEMLVLETTFSVDLSAFTEEELQSCNQDFMLSWGDNGNGYWVAGFRIDHDSMTERVFYNNAEHSQQGRLWRGNVKNPSGQYSGLIDMKNAGVEETYVLRIEITPNTVKSYLTVQNKTPYDATDDIVYTSTYAADIWPIDNNTILTPQYLKVGSLTQDKLYPNTYLSTSLNLHTDGYIAHHCAQGAYVARTGSDGSTQKISSTVNFDTLRIEQTYTKPIVPDGTTLYYEDFDNAGAADVYNHASAAYTTTVEDGVLKLVSGSNCNEYAYKLPISISNVDSFTAEIRFSVVNTGYTEIGATAGGKVRAADIMLLYGSTGRIDTTVKNGVKGNGYGNLLEGCIAGVRLNTVAEFTAILQNGIRRAYRNPGKEYGMRLGFSTASENVDQVVLGNYYTLVVEVVNGRSVAYFKGLASDGNPYSKFTLDNNRYSTDTVVGSNGIPLNYADYDNGKVDNFANNLSGVLGLYTAYKETLYIDSISVVSGLNATPDIKQVADGTVLYENDFSKASVNDAFMNQTGFNTALTDGMLFIEKLTTDNKLFLLPGSQISGVKAMTVSFDFIADKVNTENSSVMLGYNATNADNYRFVGWREGASYRAYEHYGYVASGAENSHVRYWIQKADSSVAKETFGSKSDYSASKAANYCQYSAFLQDGKVHTMKLVVTAEKAVMYIDGMRVYLKTDENLNWGKSGTFIREDYDTNALFAEMPSFAGGALGLFLQTAGTKIRIDNIVAVAGTLEYANGKIEPTEYVAQQKTLTDAQIDGDPASDYSKTGQLEFAKDHALTYGSTQVYPSACRVLWDAGYLYFYTRVNDGSYSARGDKVTYYVNEDGSVSYNSNEGAYTLTVYRDGTYSVSNTNCSGLIVKVLNDSTNYRIEVKVPLASQKNKTLCMGDEIGFNYTISDTDKDGVSLGWRAFQAGHGAFTTNPDALDKLVLSYAASPTGDTTPWVVYLAVGGTALVLSLVAASFLRQRKKKKSIQ